MTYVIPSWPKQEFFPLSEGPSVMTDPELLGKTSVFPFSRITARSSKQSPIQKRPLAIILEVILYRIRANRQRLLRIPKTMYRNSPIFTTKVRKIIPPVRMARGMLPSESAGMKFASSPRFHAAVPACCLTPPYLKSTSVSVGENSRFQAKNRGFSMFQHTAARF